jgi:predicted Zn finger-like uncharacterized protein
MQTSCPECGTAFRVHQEQLGLRRGLVRCGKCGAVFNAYDTLLPELEEPPMAPAFSGEPVHDALAGGGSPPELSPLHEVEDRPSAPAEAADSAPSVDVAVETVAEEAGETPPVADLAVPQGETAESILLSELPNRQAGKPFLPRWQAFLYVTAVFLLLLLLIMQSTYFLRAELVAAWPASRPVLEHFCRPLGCKVPLPRQLGQQAIAASNLEHDPEQKARVRLTFLLANRTGQTQAWPHVSLTLTDVREAPVARKLFPPESYLPKGTAIGTGMAHGAEREIRLELDIGNLAATGYALGLAYP